MKKIFFIVIFFLSDSCIFKAGNRSQLMGLVINKEFKSCFIDKHIDSIIYTKGLSYPDSFKQWVYFPSDVYYYPNDNKLLWFKQDSEEYYIISLYGDITLEGIHSNKLDTDWVYESNKLTKQELERIKKRIIDSLIIPLEQIKDTSCR